MANKDLIKDKDTPSHKGFFGRIKRFFRLSIAMKMLIGYLSLVGLIIITSSVSMIGLDKINELNKSILKSNTPVLEVSDELIDCIFAQELYIRRYYILHTPEMLKLFWKRSEEFNHHLFKLNDVPRDAEVPIEKLDVFHKQYDELLANGSKNIDQKTLSPTPDYEKQIKTKQEEIIGLIKQMAEKAAKDQTEKTNLMNTIGQNAYHIAFLLAIGSIFISIATAMLITKNIAGAIYKLKIATQRISEGDFEYAAQIDNNDELGDLSRAFIKMSKRLKRLEEANLDTSPLTRLPGGLAIEGLLKNRIEQNAPIAFCLMDLDNFKAFNDRYGYAKGNSLIQATGRLIQKATAKFGNNDDFVGHIGGDDFVVITTPNRYAKICNSIIYNFEKSVSNFYDSEDRKRGYIIGENRQGQQISFPLASLSIAVVTNHDREIGSYIQVGEIAAELKEHAKSLPGSVCVVDQRKDLSYANNSRSKLIAFPVRDTVSRG